MRATRRRRRRADPLACPRAVRAVLGRLREALPRLIPRSDKELVRLLRAARHALRYPASDTKRGRPSRSPRSHPLRVASALRQILARETSVG